MKSRVSRIILSILILSLALQTFTFPAIAQSEPSESQAEIENIVNLQEIETPVYPDDRDEQIYPDDGFENMPPELAERYQRDAEIEERPDAIPPSPEIIAKTQAQANSFDCSTVIDVSQIECEALVALYQSTNGAGWTNKYNWLQTARVGSWWGVTVTIDSGVTRLNLNINNLAGTIPAELGNLSNLESLGLSNSPLLTGTIPPELGNLSKLWNLSLQNDQLIGTIPLELGNLSNLVSMSLAANQLTDNIPSILGDLSKLEYLYLFKNQLTGSIPAELGNLSNLKLLHLDRNQLTGSIPTELGNLSNLENLYLHNNQLTGSIPTELGNLSSLRYLYLFENQLTGSIPTELGNLFRLGYLDIHNNQLTGVIPAELVNLSRLWSLDLSSNQLTGSIPAELGNLADLRALFLFNNQLTGSIPTELGNLAHLQDLSFSSNQLTGGIPVEFVNLDFLRYLDIHNNQLTGSIPLSFVNFFRLRSFFFSENNLCEPTTPEFIAWKNTVNEWDGTGTICEENSTDASWLLMYYMAGDNNLSKVMADEYLNIINKRQPNVDIAILYDDPFIDTSYRYIGQGGELERIEKANLNTGYGRTLTNFIEWAKSKSTAQKQALIIFDHGNGLKGVAWDDRNDKDFISINGEIRSAILDAGSVDIIWNHNCLTGNIEFMWELRGLTDYYVASESLSRGPSKHNYINDINQDTNPKELAIKIAQSYFTDYLSPKSPSTISVVDMSYINEMSRLTHELAASIRKAPKSVKDEVWSLTDYRKLQRFDLAPYGINNEDQLADLFHFASLLQNMDEFKTPATNMLNLEEDFVIFNRAWSGIFTNNNKEYIWDHSNARGVSIALPREKKSFYNGDWIKFGTGANWDYGNSTKTSSSEVEGFDWGPMISELVFLYNPDSEDQPNPPDLEPLIVGEDYPIYLPLIFR